MFIVYPTNVDYLIDDVRLRLGDIDGDTYSDSLVRAALIGSIKLLERKWDRRYLVFTNDFIVDPVPSDVTVPSGYIYLALPDGYGLVPTGNTANDIFRNPNHTFADVSSTVIAQDDESVVAAGAVIVLFNYRLSSSSSAFVNWSDGEFSYSNVATSNVLRDIYRSALDEFNGYFKSRRATPRSDIFPEILI